MRNTNSFDVEDLNNGFIEVNCHILFLSAKLHDLYSKGHPYQGYPGYIMMSNMNDSYMNNGSLSPPMPRTVSIPTRFLFLCVCNN